MKYKKYSYLIVLALMLVIGINKTYAEETKTCYYISNDNSFKASLKMTWGYKRGIFGANLKTLNDYVDVSVDKIGQDMYEFNSEVVANWTRSDGFYHMNNWYAQCTKGNAVCFDPYYKNETEANNAINTIMPGYTPRECPKYLVFQYCQQYYVWATESSTVAETAVEDAQKNGCTGFYASYEKNGNPNTAEKYYEEFEDEGIIKIDDITGEVSCSDYNTIFGSKENPNSIRHMVDTILSYVRIIVPILIILLGTIDLAKAVVSGKADNMKKAQNDFAKRIVAGVIVFLAPIIIDIVMYLADIVWAGEYVHCNL